MNNKYQSITEDNTPYSRSLFDWNFYFLIKIGLNFFGYLTFYPLINLAFFLFLLISLKREKKSPYWLLSVLIAIALLGYEIYNTSGLNSLKNIQESSKGIAVLISVWVFYFYLKQWIRFTPMIAIALILFSIHYKTSLSSSNVVTDAKKYLSKSQEDFKTLPPTEENLNAYLQLFFEKEKERHATPIKVEDKNALFDIIVVNICSLSNADLEAVGLQNHPLWQQFDLVFKQFNSATSYSGPASLRLLRASCGQPSHKDLYDNNPSLTENNEYCYLFHNLAQLGFSEELILDHSGGFDHYLDSINHIGHLPLQPESKQGIQANLMGFDGKPIDDIKSIFSHIANKHYLNQIKEEKRNAIFMNLTMLHDGNTYLNKKEATYKERATYLFDQLSDFIAKMEAQNRPILLIVVPEHGAALKSDKVQMAGLREIPTLSITQVPVGIKLIGKKDKTQSYPILINDPSSYLAVSEITSRLLNEKVLIQDTINWQNITKNLPITPVVSENENAVVMEYQNNMYIKLKKGKWISYPR